MSLAKGENPGPLKGVTVIDLTRALAGPYCTLMLVDQGARVIKVEDPAGGDDSRHVPPFIGGKSVYFSSINRDKESIALNLKNAEDRAVFEMLLESADVLVENYRPGVMDRLGYSWQNLHAQYPSLIVAAISGFGQSGPYTKRAAYDMVVQAMGGIMSITGEEGGPPVRVGVSIGDLAAGLFATIGIQGALLQRAKSLVGSRVDVSMLDCQVSLLENAVARHLATGELPARLGSRHPSITPFDVYEAQDGHMAICVGNEMQFAKLAELLGNPGLALDVRCSSIAARNENEKFVREQLELQLRRMPRAHWLQLMEIAGVPGGPINSVSELVKDPQVLARNMIIEVEDARAGKLRMAATPIKYSDVRSPEVHLPAPELDAHRQIIMRELLANAPQINE